MILAIILIGLVILSGGMLIGIAIAEKMYEKEPILSSTITVTQTKTVPLCVEHQIRKQYYESVGISNLDEILREHMAQELSREIMKYAKIDRVAVVNRDFEELFIYRARIDVVDPRETGT